MNKRFHTDLLSHRRASCPHRSPRSPPSRCGSAQTQRENGGGGLLIASGQHKSTKEGTEQNLCSFDVARFSAAILRTSHLGGAERATRLLFARAWRRSAIHAATTPRADPQQVFTRPSSHLILADAHTGCVTLALCLTLSFCHGVALCSSCFRFPLPSALRSASLSLDARPKWIRSRACSPTSVVVARVLDRCRGRREGWAALTRSTQLAACKLDTAVLLVCWCSSLLLLLGDVFVRVSKEAKPAKNRRPNKWDDFGGYAKGLCQSHASQDSAYGFAIAALGLTLPPRGPREPREPREKGR